MTFKPFIVRTACCDSLLLMTRPRVYVTCSCGATAVDAGNGYYHRINTPHSLDILTFYRPTRKLRVFKPRKKK